MWRSMVEFFDDILLSAIFVRQLLAKQGSLGRFGLSLIYPNNIPHKDCSPGLKVSLAYCSFIETTVLYFGCCG
jgi:hypothetical protein